MLPFNNRTELNTTDSFCGLYINTPLVKLPAAVNTVSKCSVSVENCSVPPTDSVFVFLHDVLNKVMVPITATRAIYSILKLTGCLIWFKNNKVY